MYDVVEEIARLPCVDASGLSPLAFAGPPGFCNHRITHPRFAGIFSIWLFPVIVILFLTAILGRKIYRVTNNPYIGGFISAAVVTVISVSNSLTYR